ncbi:Cytochrome b561 DM13 and DOMON domain-containing protein [Nymphaea thermarum]|nr:Cytochrome b561 DM13 and DOMON domain-containing protein [Nymphaea thermarum]
MVQHQLRGVFHIIDSCSFSIYGFDMIAGSPNVFWWGAPGADLANLTLGFPVAARPLDHHFRNETLNIRLLDSVSWDQFRVLAIWDRSTFSDFGHVIIPSTDNLFSSAPAPSPADDHATKDNSGLRKRFHHNQPTMFDNCISLSPNFRLRWTLNHVEDEEGGGTIDIGLEATVSSQYYMAFGWANHSISLGSFDRLMLNADVAVTGFTEEGTPFADDYFITKYSECLLNKEGSFQGVCPDAIYESTDPIGSVNNTRLIYGHHRDGVSLIRYQRPLASSDTKFDIPVDPLDNATVIWALGLIRPPDSLRPYYLPQNHGGKELVNFGYLALNVSKVVDDCIGPLEAKDKEDQDLIVADAKSPLIVTSGPSMNYPNLPSPSKVLYINKKEAPLLRVERGVPVKFSVQAGHDVALYITSDQVGGNSSSVRNTSEIVYAGGPTIQGVPASPKELVWSPDRNTPDQVYYQSFYGKKMGWKIEVVDGGLSDMYNNSVVLDDQQVTLFWTLAEGSISFAVRGEKKSGYVAIGIGAGMVNSFAYVGWIDSSGVGHVSTYWIDGREPANIHATNEELSYVRCRLESGIVTFEFTRKLAPACVSGKPECKNIIDPTIPLRLVWALGAHWSDDHLSIRNMHSATSSHPVRVLLMRGSTEAEQDLRPVLAVHGFMMFLAWGILLPSGILAARYLKHVKGDGWYQIHVYLQYSGLAIILLGILFAAAELRGFSFSSIHVKFGVAAIFLAFVQPINASFRPKKPAAGEHASPARILWVYIHIIIGRGALVVGIASLVSGLKHLGDRNGGEHVEGLNWALMVWFLIVIAVVIYLEYHEVRRKKDAVLRRSEWIMGIGAEDDSIDLLDPNRTLTDDRWVGSGPDPNPSAWEPDTALFSLISPLRFSLCYDHSTEKKKAEV